MIRKLIWTAALAMLMQGASGQMFPERSQVRQGNRSYERKNYVEAEARYMGALSKNPSSYEAHFNLGDSYFRQGRIEEAEQRFQTLSQVPYMPERWAQTHYNLGNTQVVQYKNNYNKEKLKQALESYKQSLRLNPNDPEAKFNLAYVQKLLENEQGGGGGDDNRDQNQDQNQDRNQENDRNREDPKEDPDKQEQNGEQDRNESQPQPQEGRMSREEAEQLLNAMQNNEDRTREKVDKQQAAVAGRSGKNW